MVSVMRNPKCVISMPHNKCNFNPVRHRNMSRNYFCLQIVEKLEGGRLRAADFYIKTPTWVEPAYDLECLRFFSMDMD